MKFEDIKRKLIIESFVATAALCFLGGVTYALVLLWDDYDSEKNSLQTQLASVTNERLTLENKYKKIQENIDLYRELMEMSENSGLRVSRDLLSNKIDDYRMRYFLNGLSLTMADQKQLVGPEYQYKSSTMVASDLTASFDALTDEDIFSILRSLQSDLSGGLKVTKFVITRTNKVTDEGLRTIARNGRYSMVKGEMAFTWFGIEPVEVPELKTGKSKR